MDMSTPVHPVAPPGTLTEIVEKLTLFSAFDRSNHDQMTAVALLNGRSSERKCNETTLGKDLIDEPWYLIVEWDLP